MEEGCSMQIPGPSHSEMAVPLYLLGITELQTVLQLQLFWGKDYRKEGPQKFLKITSNQPYHIS